MLLNKKRVSEILVALVTATLLLSPGANLTQASAVSKVENAPPIDSRTFPETGKTASGTFLTYWDAHGGLNQQGYPISDEQIDTSPTDGNSYTVQYFERAVFEKHPENKPPYNILLSLLGVQRFREKYPRGLPAGAEHIEPGAVLYKETGKHLGGQFKAYWEQHGGLAQQGFPISEQFTEVSDLDNKPYTVQYFERAVFEKHPQNKALYDVLLSQLGTFQYRKNIDSRGIDGTLPPVSNYRPYFYFAASEMNWPQDPTAYIRNTSLYFADKQGSTDIERPVNVKAGGGYLSTNNLPAINYTDIATRLGLACSDRASCLKVVTVKGQDCYDSGWKIENVQGKDERVLWRARPDKDAKPDSKGQLENSCGGKGIGYELQTRNDDYKVGFKPTLSVPLVYDNRSAVIFYQDQRGTGKGSKHRIQWWVFYGYNDASATAPLGQGKKLDHQGDWEGVAVQFAEDNKTVVSWNYFEHGACNAFQPLVGKEQNRPVVWVGRGTHASYPVSGNFVVQDVKEKVDKLKVELNKDYKGNIDISGRLVALLLGQIRDEIPLQDQTPQGNNDPRNPNRPLVWDVPMGSIRNAATQPWWGYAGVWGKYNPGSVTVSKTFDFWLASKRVTIVVPIDNPSGPDGPGPNKGTCQDIDPSIWPHSSQPARPLPEQEGDVPTTAAATVDLTSSPPPITNVPAASFAWNIYGTATTECRVDDGGQFVPCASPYTVNVSPGTHRLDIVLLRPDGSWDMVSSPEWTYEPNITPTVTQTPTVTPIPTVTVPNVRESSVAGVRAQLEAAPYLFVVTLSSIPDARCVQNQNCDTVVRTDPDAGSQVRVGSSITIVYRVYEPPTFTPLPPMTTVPSVKDRTVATARATLEGDPYHFVVTLSSIPDARCIQNQNCDTVVRTDPAAGSQLGVGSRITIVYRTAP